MSLIDFGISGRTISLTSDNKDYFKPKSQDKQSTNNQNIITSFRKMKDVINKWVEKYNNISIGSSNKKRAEYYHKWLSDTFTCTSIKSFGINPITEEEMFGFYISK